MLWAISIFGLLTILSQAEPAVTPTAINEAKANRIVKDLNRYATQVVGSPEWTSIYDALNSALPAQFNPSTFDLIPSQGLIAISEHPLSFASNPEAVITEAPAPSYYTYLPTTLQDQFDNFRASVADRRAQIVVNDLNSPNVAPSSRLPMGSATGLATIGILVGAAAILL